MSSRQYEFGCLRNWTLTLAVLEILLHWHLPEPDYLFVFNMDGVVPKVYVPRCDCRFPGLFVFVGLSLKENAVQATGLTITICPEVPCH